MEDETIIEYRNRITLQAFLYNFIGTTLPFLILLFILPIKNGLPSIIEPIQKGDWFLYSAGVWSTCLFMSFENKNKGSKLDSIFGTVSWFCIAISACAYVYIFQDNSTSSTTSTTNANNTLYIAVISFIILAFGSYFLYRQIRITNRDKLPTIDVQAKSQRDIDLLKEQMK